MGDEAGGADGAEVEVRSSFADGLIGFRVLGQGDECAVAAKDAGLFARNLRDGVPKVVLVVERDVSDNGEQRVDNVSGVQAAAEAYFQDGNIDRFGFAWPVSCEVEEG